MKKTILLLLIFFSAITINNSGCTSGKIKSSGFTITGNVEGLRNRPVILDRVSFSNQNETVKEVKAENGQFTIDLPQNPGVGYYRIRSGRQSVYIILDGTENSISVEGKYTKFNNNYATVSGSKFSEKFNSILQDLKNRKIDIYKTKSIAKESDPVLGSVLVVNVFGSRPEFLDIHEAVYKNLENKYPDLYLTKDYKSIIDSLKKAYARQQARAKIKVGMPAPDIAMPNPDGKILKLSDLKGKIVLIDFWASWCGPCIRSFPDLTKTYQKYKDKGFTVFSVSLDGVDSRSAKRYKTPDALAAAKKRAKEKWINAIKKHKLTWSTHVSDLDKWDCKAAANYGVTSIPRTFLIDREGNIAAVNPRFNLEEAIVKVLNKN